MAERDYTIPQALGQDRQLVTPMDLLRASEFVTDVLSGSDNYVSGQSILTVVLSSVTRIRPLNVHMHNRETAAMTLVFRDGGISGDIVAGPYIVNATQGRTIPPDDLIGRRFLSGIYAVVLSGTYAQGIDLNIGHVVEPDPADVGGYLE